jgi:hypothetical protein
MHQPTRSPIACRMTPEAQRARQQELDDDLFSGTDQVRELDNGYAFRFPGSADWIDRITRFIKVERDCCPFFTFELAFGPDQGPVWLHLRGPEGTKEFIAQQLRSGT